MLPDQIDVDYRRSLLDVYIDVARFALFHPDMRGLEVLGLVFKPADDASNRNLLITFEPRMPSWVAGLENWSYNLQTCGQCNRSRSRPAIAQSLS